MASGEYTRRLHLAATSPLRTLLMRGLWVLLILFLAWLMLWTARDGLKDNGGHHLGVLDVVYFSVVTVTTLGYGDIVPVSPTARAIVTFGITPLRVLVWVLFLSTAYEFLLRRSIEQIEMQRLKSSLRDHVIVCGFGVKGRTAVKELVERGKPLDQILVIDPSPEMIDEANRVGVNFLLGNATSEQVLKDAAIEKCGQAIVVPNDDEACVLICLTIQELAPQVRIMAAAREEENIKLIRRSGAEIVIAPSVSGGQLLAAATTSPASTELIEELFVHGRGADIYDLAITAKYVGKEPAELNATERVVVLAVRTISGDLIPYRSCLHRPLQAGDTAIVFSPPSPNDKGKGASA